jgi:AMMECR1 domain-containing protein
VNKEKLEDTFDELFRSDLLAMARQTVMSILDPTAAKPPALVTKDAAKSWPVYISLYNPEGKLGGQAGSYRAVGPLEESIRQFSFEAVRAAKPALTKENAKKWVVDVSIPHGFNSVTRPEELVPLLNGIIVEHAHRRSAFHPDSWRTYPDPHQLLGAICAKLGLIPWAYATQAASIESFRVLSFNEKDPYQTLSPSKKKKRRGAPAGGEDPLDDSGDSGGDSSNTGGGFPF